MGQGSKGIAQRSSFALDLPSTRRPTARGGSCHASHHRSRPRCRRRWTLLDRCALPARRPERRHRSGACRGLYPRRTGLVRDVDRPRRAGPDAERTWPRAVGSRRRVGVRNDRPDGRPAGIRPERLDPQRLPGRVHRSGGPQPRSPSGRHRPRSGRGSPDLEADGMAGAHRSRSPSDRPRAVSVRSPCSSPARWEPE